MKKRIVTFLSVIAIGLGSSFAPVFAMESEPQEYQESTIEQEMDETYLESDTEQENAEDVEKIPVAEPESEEETAAESSQETSESEDDDEADSYEEDYVYEDDYTYDDYVDQGSDSCPGGAEINTPSVEQGSDSCLGGAEVNTPSGDDSLSDEAMNW